jgi:type I restriction enzyme M protein
MAKEKNKSLESSIWDAACSIRGAKDAPKYKDYILPLIIDDALGFSDPSRLETMGAAIAAAGKHYQIIILTCTPGRFMHLGSAEVVRF